MIKWRDNVNRKCNIPIHSIADYHHHPPERQLDGNNSCIPHNWPIFVVCDHVLLVWLLALHAIHAFAYDWLLLLPHPMLFPPPPPPLLLLLLPQIQKYRWEDRQHQSNHHLQPTPRNMNVSFNPPNLIATTNVPEMERSVRIDHKALHARLK